MSWGSMYRFRTSFSAGPWWSWGIVSESILGEVCLPERWQVRDVLYINLLFDICINRFYSTSTQLLSFSDVLLVNSLTVALVMRCLGATVAACSLSPIASSSSGERIVVLGQMKVYISEPHPKYDVPNSRHGLPVYVSTRQFSARVLARLTWGSLWSCLLFVLWGL